MENNEICMSMDVKLDIPDKKPDSLKFKTWTRCQVKIEAIKCLPCFLRISLLNEDEQGTEQGSRLSVSVNVPGVSISLATSRTKQYSYGLFWNHNRRDCFIYFALETELSCRRHMRWLKKSMKNLELYRQIFLEQRRNSRGPGQHQQQQRQEARRGEFNAIRAALKALGPLPKIPDFADDNNSSIWSQRMSQASEIYEEIIEGIIPERLSRRLSRGSIASGIYEEMKPTSYNFGSIVEENIELAPPLPPLPPPRKRLNTFETETGLLDDLPRSNTTPESELAKKKKYRNVLDNIFGSKRSKRAESLGENQTCSAEDIINGDPKEHLYANDDSEPNGLHLQIAELPETKRNSFSSPDLSKINFLDTFDETKLARILLEREEGLQLSNGSLDISDIKATSGLVVERKHWHNMKAESLSSLNLSEQLPMNFNFSACNTSNINLIGANGAVPTAQMMKHNKILIDDDLTGYCVMAPIIESKSKAPVSTTSSSSSGYSTGSHCSSSSSSSHTNSNEDRQQHHNPPATIPETVPHYDSVPKRMTPLPVNEDGVIYENMLSSSLNGSNPSSTVPDYVAVTTPLSSKDFTDNLYENLLTEKATQELGQPSSVGICTSTPTEQVPSFKESPKSEEENFYQTPRKSIISIDDKIPSYYPNSCDIVRTRKSSPLKVNAIVDTPTCCPISNTEKSSNPMGLRHLVNAKLRRERKENFYISSPQKILEQRQSSFKKSPSSVATNGKKATSAQKISENVYAVKHANKKSYNMVNANNNNNNNINEKSSYNDDALKEKLQAELLHLALLQNIDFKFDESPKTPLPAETIVSTHTATPTNRLAVPKQSGLAMRAAAEEEYENCFQASKDAARLLHRYATLAPNHSTRIKQQQLQQHHLQVSQTANRGLQKCDSARTPMSESKLETAVSGGDSVRKFASLPRFKKIDFSPLKLKINNVLQRNQPNEF